MQKLFIDSDVCLDVLIDREPFADKSKELFSLIYEEKVEGLISSLSVVNIHYFLRKDVREPEAREIIARLKSFVTTLDVTDSIIEQALASPIKDFEDAVQFYTALKAGAENLITRNTKDFKKSSIPVYTPEEYLKNFT